MCNQGELIYFYFPTIYSAMILEALGRAARSNAPSNIIIEDYTYILHNLASFFFFTVIKSFTVFA